MRTKYKFSHQAGGYYYWMSVQPLVGDSRYEQISCSVNYFWNNR